MNQGDLLPTVHACQHGFPPSSSRREMVGIIPATTLSLPCRGTHAWFTNYILPNPYALGSGPNETQVQQLHWHVKEIREEINRRNDVEGISRKPWVGILSDGKSGGIWEWGGHNDMAPRENQGSGEIVTQPPTATHRRGPPRNRTRATPGPRGPCLRTLSGPPGRGGWPAGVP